MKDFIFPEFFFLIQPNILVSSFQKMQKINCKIVKWGAYLV